MAGISWTRLLARSARNTSPAVSTATASGVSSTADVAGPPSPKYPDAPTVPAMVEMVPVAETFRITELSSSAIYKFPDESTATANGFDRKAEVAGPPSPPLPGRPVELPATV